MWPYLLLWHRFGAHMGAILRGGAHQLPWIWLELLREFQLPSTGALTSGNLRSRASMGELAMVALWQWRLARTRVPPAWHQRLKNASRWSKQWSVSSQNVNLQFSQWSGFDFWLHQMQLSKRRIQDQAVFTSSFYNRTNGNFPCCASSICASSRHQMQQLKQTIQVQEVFTWSFSSQTDHKFVTVLWPTIVQSFRHYGSLQKPTSPSWNSRWCSTP